LINGFRRFAGACCLRSQGRLRRLCRVQETVCYMRTKQQISSKMTDNYLPINMPLYFTWHEYSSRTLWKPQISLYLITFSETKPWSSLQFEYTSCDGVLRRRNSHMGRNRKRFHSNSHCGLLELRLADNKMGEGISNSPTGLSV